MGNSTGSRLTIRAAGAALVALAMVFALPLVADAEAPGPVAGWSTTTGTDGRVYMADEQGRALQHHGFANKSDSPQAKFSEQFFEDAALRGMDHFRLGFFWQNLEPEQGEFDEAFLDQIEVVLDRAERHGILVILDMHQDVFGEAFGSKGIPAWATRDDGLPFVPSGNFILDYLQPGVQAAWEHLYEDADIRQWQIDAWVHVVERVKDHPALFGYDLLNEPFGKIRPGEDLFSGAERVEREQMTPMFQRLTDAISAIDSDHWVFFEPPNLASLGVKTSLGEITGPKVAIYPHMYDASIENATYSPDGVIELDPEFFDKWADAITSYTDKYPMPMMVGEWGIASPGIPGMDEFVERSLETLDRVTSGWSHWAWCRGGGYCPVDADGNDRPVIDQIFQPYARAIAGAPTSTTWDRQAKALELRFADNEATGTTDFYLAAGRSYPDGWRVETSDADGTWSSTYDESTGVLSVTTAKTAGPHAICVKPVDAPAPGADSACRAGGQEPTDTTTSTTTPGSSSTTTPTSPSSTTTPTSPSSTTTPGSSSTTTPGTPSSTTPGSQPPTAVTPGSQLPTVVTPGSPSPVGPGTPAVPSASGAAPVAGRPVYTG